MLYSQPQTGPLRIDANEPLTAGLIQAQTGLGVIDAVVPFTVPTAMGTVTQRPDGLEFSSAPAGTARLVLPHEKTDQFTSIIILKALGTASGFASIFGLMYDAAGNSPYGDQLDRDSTGVALRFAFNVGGNPTSLNTTNNLSSTQFDTIAMTFQSGSQAMYQNGAVIASATLTGTPVYSATSVIGLGNVLGDGRNANVLIKFAARWNRVLSKAEIDAVSANPWRLFEDPYDSMLMVAGAVDTTLTGAAAAQASAAGALSTSIRLTAGAAAVASATGSLSTSVRMAGAASAQAGAAGTLSTAIQLSGTASASAGASGTLAGGAATLAGTAVASATASGALTTAVRLTGTSAAQAGASGSLTTQTKLAGAASAGASASGALSTGIALSGAAQATASASGTLAGGAAQLSGAAVASVSAGGALSTGIRLSGAATAQASASGALAGTGAVLSGAAVARASASGALLTTIRMTGLAAASASASGTLDGGVIARPTIPTSRTVNFDSGSNRVNFDNGINRVNFDSGSNRVDF
jgi:hypothetical protein